MTIRGFSGFFDGGAMFTGALRINLVALPRLGGLRDAFRFVLAASAAQRVINHSDARRRDVIDDPYSLETLLLKPCHATFFGLIFGFTSFRVNSV